MLETIATQASQIAKLGHSLTSMATRIGWDIEMASEKSEKQQARTSEESSRCITAVLDMSAKFESFDQKAASTSDQLAAKFESFDQKAASTSNQLARTNAQNVKSLLELIGRNDEIRMKSQAARDEELAAAHDARLATHDEKLATNQAAQLEMIAA
jgi:hypothetical protein